MSIFFCSSFWVCLTLVGSTLVNQPFMSLSAGGVLENSGTLFVLLTTLLFSVYSLLCDNKGKTLSMSALGLVLVIFFCVDSPLWFFVFFELALVPMGFVIISYGLNPERLVSFFYLMVYTSLGSFPLLMNILAQESGRGENSFFFFQFTNYSKQEFTLFYSVCLFFWIFAFLVKSPLYGVHLWLPKAHVEAPTVGSMALAAILLKMGTFGLLRFSGVLESAKFKVFLFSWVLLGLVLSCVLSFRSFDIKVFIAYSSVAHMGLTMLVFWGYSAMGYMGLIFISVSHAFSSSGLFFFVESYYQSAGSRNLGLSVASIKYSPLFSLTLFLLCAAKASFPPVLSLFGELYVFQSLLPISSGFVSFFVAYVFLVGLYKIFLYLSVAHGYGSKVSGAFKANPNSLGYVLSFFSVLCFMSPLVMGFV